MEPGGNADKSGVCLGEEIIQWNGQSLVNATYETTRSIVAGETSDTVEVMLMPTKRKRVGSLKLHHQDYRRQWGGGHECGITRKRNVSRRRSKRHLPMSLNVCVEQVHSPSVGGKLAMVIRHDLTTATLTLKVSRAAEIPYRPGTDKELPCCFVQIYVLPKSNEFESFRTQTVMFNNEPRWSETFAYHDMSWNKCVNDHTNVSTTTPAFVFQMQCRSLEVVLWDSLANNSPMFLGEVVLDLNQTHFSDDAVWYSLFDHDENIGPPPTSSLGQAVPGLPTPGLGVEAAADGNSICGDDGSCVSRANSSRSARVSLSAAALATPSHDRLNVSLKRSSNPGENPRYTYVCPRVFSDNMDGKKSDAVVVLSVPDMKDIEQCNRVPFGPAEPSSERSTHKLVFKNQQRGDE
ncbi:hypothetical protein LSAT2_006249 [Lamellibrachia satsuma]|nr:hypothetical protein LSAT2_006249 [Lamellibrachia satsuma]